MALSGIQDCIDRVSDLSGQDYFCNSMQEFDVPFIQSFGKKLYDSYMAKEIHYCHGIIPTSSAPLMKYLKALYEQNSIANMQSDKSPRIPLVVHMIWLGGKLPEKWKQMRRSWIEKHPHWLHILWVDKAQDPEEGQQIDLDQLHTYMRSQDHKGKMFIIDVSLLPLINKDAYGKAKNLGIKSDILRYEILYQFGGVYVDTDVECLTCFDMLHYRYDFYAGLVADPVVLYICNAIIACTQQNDIIRTCIQDLGKHVIKGTQIWWLETSTTSGPLHLTTTIAHYDKLFAGANVVLPPSFFYPKVGEPQKESMAIHHWAASWR